MPNKPRIKESAKERAITLLSIAKELGIYRSNMSAIASGKRGASLAMLEKICFILNCSLDELVFPGTEPIIFKDKALQKKLIFFEKASSDGADKTWVNRVVLSGLIHFKHSRRAK